MTRSSRPQRQDWDAVAATYEAAMEHVTSQFVDRLLDMAMVDEHSELLDVACGTGIASLAAAERGATVTALDFSPAMLARLMERLLDDGDTRITPLEGDALDVQIDDASFSAAVSNFGVILCPDATQAINEMVRVVQPGGRVALSAWTRPTENSWTAILPPNHGDQLGFELQAFAFYEWESADALATSLAGAGLTDVVVELHRGDGPVVRDLVQFRKMFDSSPIMRAQLTGLSDDQRNKLAGLIIDSLQAATDGLGQVTLPASAWLAAGTVPVG